MFILEHSLEQDLWFHHPAENPALPMARVQML
jgi:hypothetical protein